MLIEFESSVNRSRVSTHFRALSKVYQGSQLWDIRHESLERRISSFMLTPDTHKTTKLVSCNRLESPNPILLDHENRDFFVFLKSGFSFQAYSENV